jgi:hypothetical protein
VNNGVQQNNSVQQCNGERKVGLLAPKHEQNAAKKIEKKKKKKRYSKL